MTGYQIDFCAAHDCIRLTVTAEILTLELAEDIYKRLKQISSSGGPYATIYDLTMVKDTTIPVEMVKGYARRNPSVPMGRPHVIVAEEITIYGLARLFQVCREHIYGLFEVVHTLEEAYKIVGVTPEDFTQRL
jgi:hypothetical protein